MRIGLLSLLALAIAAATNLARADADYVDRVDTHEVLRPPKPVVRAGDTILRYGTLVVCARESTVRIRAEMGSVESETGCRIFPLIYRHDQGDFPKVDTLIDGARYSAREIHLLRREDQWFLFLEGHDDTSISTQHQGTVLRLRRFAPPERICSSRIEAYDESNSALYACIPEKIRPRDAALIHWLDPGQCEIDYSICSADAAD